MLLASNWVLNTLAPDEKFDLYPSALKFSNHVTREAQLKKVRIPDQHPGSTLRATSVGKKKPASERMAMTAADFVMLYSNDEYCEMFDAVATVFFVDTAPNVIRYIETIHGTLKPGGVWVNVGPLLWHFEDRAPPHDDGDTPKPPGSNEHVSKGGIEEPGSFELTAEELLLLVERLGFTIERKEMREDGHGYIQDPASMITSAYKTLHFVARKSAG
jgi:carnosine N-methyltransferase